jgi:hypothetical protein
MGSRNKEIVKSEMPFIPSFYSLYNEKDSEVAIPNP